MDCLEILVKLSIISNCALLFWTSKYFHVLFVSAGSDGLHGSRGDLNKGMSSISSITSGWTNTDFLKAVIYVEHVIILFQIFLRQIVTDVTPEIIKGERDRATILTTHLKKAEGNIKAPISPWADALDPADDNWATAANRSGVVTITAQTDFRQKVADDFSKKIHVIGKQAYKFRKKTTKGLLL
jgi:hypothetical protein